MLEATIEADKESQLAERPRQLERVERRQQRELQSSPHILCNAAATRKRRRCANGARKTRLGRTAKIGAAGKTA